VRATTGDVFSLSVVSREYKILGFVRKRMKYCSWRRDPQQRADFWTNPPCDAHGNLQAPHVAGVRGVATADMVFLDGATFYCDRANRVVGHAPLGFEARQSGNPHHYGRKWNCLLAADISGVVAYWLYDVGGTTTAMWHMFLQYFVLPAIAGRPRCLVQDNEQSHMDPIHRVLVQAAGHIIVHTPIHSPDFNMVEWDFEQVALYLQTHMMWVTSANLCAALHAALATITGVINTRYAVRAHYFVPGAAEYRPYLG